MDEHQILGHIFSFALFGALCVQLCESFSVLAIDMIVIFVIAIMIRLIYRSVPA